MVTVPITKEMIDQARGLVVEGSLRARSSYEGKTNEELEKIVQEAVLKVGAKTPANFGKVMGAVMPKIAGRASGNQVSAVVREHLS